MARRLGLLGVLLCLALAGWFVALTIDTPLDQSPLYTVAQAQARLMRQPRTWIGQVIRVRARAGERCVAWVGGQVPACMSWQPALLDAGDRPDTALALRTAAPPLLAALRRLPLLGVLAPRDPAILWGTVAVYRVRLQAQTDMPCGARPCYGVVLLDSASGSP